MQGEILIVDDIEMNRDMLSMMLSDSYNVRTFEDGQQLIDYLEQDVRSVKAILLDLVMPKVDGFGVIKYMNDKKIISQIPVLVLTSEEANNIERDCLGLGADDFIRKPFDATIVKRRITNMVELYDYRRSLEAKVESQTKTLQLQNKMLTQQTEKLAAINDKIIDLLGNVVEYRNLESGEHIKRVKGFTKILAEELKESYPEYKLTEKAIETIVSASSLHDIGKIAISDTVLLKPGRLTAEEYEYMKSHTTRGCDILDQIDIDWSPKYKKTCYEICRYHHERFDGKGYPDGLKGDEIPISAQLVSVADVYDALVSERVYKSAYDKEKAFQMIINGECGVFSPVMMACFRKSKEKLEALANKNKKLAEKQ